MRPVLFKRWITGIKCPNGTTMHPYYKNTNCYEEEFTQEGNFHEWFNTSSGVIALVELPDGTIEELPSSSIKFVDKLNLNE